MDGEHDQGAEAAASRGHFAEASCLNCGTILAGAYCHDCGQQAHLHRTIGAFLHDLLHGVLHLEGRTWRTLPQLALQPGKLTRDYIDGQRTRYVSPMALFLFSLFLMFAVFQAAGISPRTDIEGDSVAEVQLAAQGDDNRIATSNPTIAAGIAKWRENPSLMLYKLQANGYKFSWLLIPLSLPFVALVFAWRRRFGLYDHAVFVTYSIAFMTLFFIAVTLAALAGVPQAVLGLLAMLVPPLHLYRHVRGAYQLSRFSALWRTLALGAFIVLVLVMFGLVLLTLGALG
jgi:hypothetical protein